MSDLKPCPFCGGEAATNTIIYSAKDDVVKLNGQDMFFGVNCIKCGVNNRGLVGYKTEDEAIEAWNARPKSEAEWLLKEALREILIDSFSGENELRGRISELIDQARGGE